MTCPNRFLQVVNEKYSFGLLWIVLENANLMLLSPTCRRIQVIFEKNSYLYYNVLRFLCCFFSHTQFQSDLSNYLCENQIQNWGRKSFCLSVAQMIFFSLPSFWGKNDRQREKEKKVRKINIFLWLNYYIFTSKRSIKYQPCLEVVLSRVANKNKIWMFDWSVAKLVH